MNTKRIRCSCGRVYDPVKRPACPDCGTVNKVVTAPPDPPPLPNESDAPASKEARGPIPPRYLAIGAAIFGVLALLIFLGRDKGGKAPVIAVEEATPAPTATVSVAPATPVPSATAVVQREASSPTPLSSVASIPTPAPTKIPAADDDLATLVANAAPGATIKVRPGTYTGLTLTRPVKLVGDPSAPVFIKGEGQSALTVKSQGVFVENIQFLTNGIGALPAIAVVDGAALEMKAVAIQSTTEVGVLVAGKASLKAVGTSFAVPSGAGLRLQEAATAHLTQCTFSDSKSGLNAMTGARAELHACAFERDGGSNGRGSIIALSGPGTAVTADDCRFQEQRRRRHR